MPDRRRDRDQRNKGRNGRCHEQPCGSHPRQRASRALLFLTGQVPDEPCELAQRLCLIAALEPLLKLIQVEAAFAMACAEALGYVLAIRVGSAEIRVAAGAAIPQVLLGHQSLHGTVLTAASSLASPPSRGAVGR
jgi:hypothetical protein